MVKISQKSSQNSNDTNSEVNNTPTKLKGTTAKDLKIDAKR